MSHRQKRHLATLFFLIIGLTYSLSWSYRIFTQGGLTNSDFLATYTALRLIHDGDSASLYDLAHQSRAQHAVAHLKVPPLDLLPFIHPPFYLLPLLPLGWLSYRAAFSLMALLNLTLMGLLVRLLPQYLPQLRPSLTLTLACFTFFPYFVTLIQGQNAALTLLIFTVTYHHLKQGHDRQAGALLALALYKPQLVAVWLIIFFLKQRWGALMAFSFIAFILLILSYFMVGLTGFSDYLRLTITASPLIDGAFGVNYASMHNWRALFRLLMGPSAWVNPLTLTADVITLSLLLWAWRGAWQPLSPKFDLQFALTIMTILLISPHLNTHDLTLWLLVAALLWHYAHTDNATFSSSTLTLLIISGSLLPFGTIALTTTLHFPLTTVFMVGVMGWLLLQLSRDEATHSNTESPRPY